MLHTLTRQVRYALCLLLFALNLVATQGYAALPASVDGEPLPTLAPMLERVTPAVVNIATVGHVRLQLNPLFNDPFFRRFFDLPDTPRQRRTQSLGSGVIVDAAQGYVLTNHHVIQNADEIRVQLHDGRTFTAELIGTDPETDVAVIRIPAENLTALRPADSDRLRVGDFVVAIGNPFGLGQTVTSGMVSALGRSGLGIEGYEDFIQTDASINPGNSGGALVNLRGELVGINTAIIGPSGGNVGIGFAIPANMARAVMQQLVEHGRVERGRLGVSVQDLTPELARAFDLSRRQGTVVADVSEGSPADRAGLEVGDIILMVNGRPVGDSADVRNHIGLLRVGDSVRLTVLRDGRKLELTARIEAAQSSRADGGRFHPRLEGARLREITGDISRPGRRRGILVEEVTPGSPAARAGLQAGDVIVSVNRQPVNDLAGLREAAHSNGKGLLLNLQRGRGAMFLLLR
ncbi:MAG: serine endoprotease DegQ [Gammaproteobacteria bacterium]|nr:serine endoprotease DegQ [Gammaproteobacteria bacterium]